MRIKMKGVRFGFYLFIFMLLGLQGCLPLPAANSVPQTGASAATAPEIQSADVLQSDTPKQVLLVVKAALPNTCMQLGEAAVERQGQEFNISLPAVKMGDQGCQAASLSQAQIIHLPVDSLSPGNYIVLVNGFLSSFRLDAAGNAQPAPVQVQATVVAAATTVAADAAPSTTSTLVPAQAPTSTAASIAAEASIIQPTPTPTPLAFPVGKDPANCVNKAAFYGNLNIPDGTPFAPGSKFTKTWLVMNVGSCTWGPGYQLVFAGGDPLGAAQKIPMPAARPKQVVQVSVDMLAPVPAGSYESDWAIVTPEGYVFGLGNPAVTPLAARISVVQLPVGLPSGLECGALRMKDMEQQVLDQINSTRAQFGLYPLVLVEDISQVALKHSLEMACYNYESHFGRDGNLYNVRLQQGNIPFATSNEIIYSGNGGPAGAVDWWMHSHIHRPIVLSTKYTKVGIGFVYYNQNPYAQRITVDFIHP